MNGSQELFGSIKHYLIELSALDLLAAEGCSRTPNAHNYHNVLDFHLLKKTKEFLACSRLSIVIVTLSENLGITLHRLGVIYSVSHYFVLCRREPGMNEVVDVP